MQWDNCNSFTRKALGNKYQNSIPNWMPVAHTCNPSYSEGRDQEDHSMKPAQANI
jgi:hypothetical protein